MADTATAGIQVGSDTARIDFARPKSIAEVARRIASSVGGDAHLREFLDAFYTEQSSDMKTTMLSEEPTLLKASTSNAYLAAVAEHLSREYGLIRPTWIEKPERFLRRAHFPCGLESLKAILIARSPASFRRRMIFVDESALYRPRKDAVGFTVEPILDRGNLP